MYLKYFHVLSVVSLGVFFVGSLSSADEELTNEQVEALFRHSSQVVELKTEFFSLEFNREGRPTCTLKKKSGDNQLLSKNPGQGFVASLTKDGEKTESRLSKIARQGNWLVAGNESVKIVFFVQEKPNYITLDLKQVIERNGTRLSTLKMEVNCENQFKAWPLDIMTQVGKTGIRNSIGWNWLWEKNKQNPLGKIAISAAASETVEDDILLQLWVHEGLPHPNVGHDWNEQTAREWLANWQQQFHDQSTMIIQPANESELYALAAMAIELGIKKIYLHTDVWRGEYWPRKRSFLNVNKSVFQNGEASLVKFADYLHRHDVGIALHMVSGAIAFNDPDYVAGTPNPDLASFLNAELVDNLEAHPNSILIRPDKGSSLPEIVGRHVVGPHSYPFWMDVNCFQIGNQLVVARNQRKRNDGLIELNQISPLSLVANRQTDPLSNYPRGTRVRGLLRPYAQVFTAEVDSNLLDKITKRYAEFCNRNHINHLECDALENHQSKPWGPNKFAWKLYEQIDHPCTSNTSSGKPLPFHIEYWFNSSKIVKQNRPQGGVAGGDGMSLLLASADRVATGPYGRHVKPTIAFTRGSQSVNLIRPVPMFGISKRLLVEHGLGNSHINEFKRWKKLLTANKFYLNEVPTRDNVYLVNHRMVSNHPALDYLLRPNENGEKLTLERFDVMRTANSPIKWSWGQEFGPLVPKTYFVSGDGGQELNNPFPKQEPEVLIRVMSSFVPTDRTALGKEFPQPDDQVDAEIKKQYRKGVEGLQAQPAYDSNLALSNTKPISANINLLPKNLKSAVLSENQALEMVDGKFILSAENATQNIVHCLHRASWPVNLNLLHARGLEIAVTGDQSGAVFVVSLGHNNKRDYVIPIDFKGTRRFLIPSGEVAWSDENWGWRKSARHFDYSQVKKIEAGFGTLPPNCKASITIESMQAVGEHSVEVNELKINVGDGSLTVKGPVQTGNYVWFTGGDRATIFDSNWQKMRELKVAKNDFLVLPGKQKISLETSGASPYLETQLIVTDHFLAPRKD